MIGSLDGLLPIMLHDPLIRWPCKIRGSLAGGGSARKRLSRHQLLVSIFVPNRIKENNQRSVFLIFGAVTYHRTVTSIC